MSAAEHAWRETTFAEELHSLVDARTLEIVERRRNSATARRRGWLVRRALLLADVAGLFTAFLIAENLFIGRAASADHLGPATEWLLFLLTLPAWIIVAKLYRLYDRDEERTDHSTVDDVLGVFHLVTVCTWLFFAGAWFTGAAAPHMPKLMTFWLLAILLVCTARATARSLCRRNDAYLQNAIIVGAGDAGQMIARKFLNHPEYGVNLVGFVDSRPGLHRDGVATVLGRPERLPGLIRMLDVERVIVADWTDPRDETIELVRSIKDFDVQVDILPRLFELVGPNAGLHTVEGVQLVGLPSFKLSRSSLLLKRTLDLVFSFGGLVLLAPLFALAAAAIKLDSPGPVFFRQTRMGRDGTFRIWKFRTMTADADQRKAQVAHLNKHLASGGDARMFKIPNDPRVTRVGRFLRRYSLDEFAQLVNVIKGEMSLVGPRPLILEEDRHIAGWGRQRLDLKPGCTGPWQVLGGSDIPFEEMLNLDYLYVTSWSLLGDVALMFRTLAVLGRNQNA